MQHRFRTLVFLTLATIGVGAVLLFGGLFYWQATAQLQQHLDQRLQAATDGVHALVDTAARVAMRSHLRVVAEWHRDRAAELLAQAERDGRPRDEAVSDIATMMLSQQVGESGYIYCLDSAGNVPVHPQPGVRGTNASEHAFVRRQMALKEGYIEYDWRNPGESESRLKALYMCYLPELDWIVTASCYRNEVRSLIDEDDFRERILAVELPAGGYPYVVDYRGTAIVHPYLSGEAMAIRDQMPDFYAAMMAAPEGGVEYRWANPHERSEHRRLGLFRHIPDLEWVVFSSVYLDRVYAPLETLRWWLFAAVVAMLAISFLVAAWLSARLGRPLRDLVTAFEHDPATGGPPPRLIPTGPLEFARLAERYNGYMDRQQRAEEEIRSARRMLQIVLDTIPVGVFWCDANCELLGCNLRFRRDHGCCDGGCAGCTSLTDCSWRGEAARIKEALTALLDGREDRCELDVVFRFPDGDERQLHMLLVPMYDQRDERFAMLGIYEDVSEQRRLQEQLHHAQRLESIGQLAAGVAHDFNNALTAVMGAAELLSQQARDERQQRLTGTIRRAAEHAADLTAKLLAFARTGSGPSAPVDLHTVIGEVRSLLEHAIDPRIELVTELAARRRAVIGDASQLQSALLNLGINARDAMPDGGRLGIRTREVVLDETACEHLPFDVSPGPYICCEVCDNGCGMPPAILGRIFEPYFTTKPAGKGNGLGLAAVFGTAGAHGGAIEVQSREGEGSRFSLLLPLIAESTDRLACESAAAPRGSGTVLVVDDDDMVREMVAAMLDALGYRAVQAESGVRALAVAAEFGAAIDLLILDMLMPDRLGPEVLSDLRHAGLEAPALLVSGYAADGTLDRALVDPHTAFLHKPFRSDELARAIGALLG